MIPTSYFTQLKSIDEWKQKQLTTLESISDPIYYGNSSKKVLSLMINVAWGNDHLLNLLTILKNHNVKATFFLTGSWLNKYPHLGKKILEDGHDVGNHAYSHPDLRGLPLNKIKCQLQKTNEAIETTLGITPQLFTPPSSEFDERVLYLASKEGMLTVLSTIQAADWENSQSENLINQVELNLINGCIILFHPTESSVLALPQIIKFIKENDYMIIPLTDLLTSDLETEKIRSLNVEEDTFYIDGHPISSEYIFYNNDLMLPAYFFKNADLEIKLDSPNNQIVLSNASKTITFNLLNGLPYLSLKDVTHSFDIDIFYDPDTLRIYLLTNSSEMADSQIVFNNTFAETKVALTFDDGPDNHNTPKILDILKSKGVKATFFISGSQASYLPEILKRIAQEGHLIGNHAWSHPDLTKLFTPEVIKEIESTQKIIYSLTGLTPSLFRPPGGNISLSDCSVIHNLGFKIINWNIDTLDYLGHSVEQILDIIEKEISPGSIILQHCYQDSTGTLDGTLAALPIIIDTLRAKNMNFVTIEELLN